LIFNDVWVKKRKVDDFNTLLSNEQIVGIEDFWMPLPQKNVL
jgi:hypothetical protein